MTKSDLPPPQIPPLPAAPARRGRPKKTKAAAAGEVWTGSPAMVVTVSGPTAPDFTAAASAVAASGTASARSSRTT